MREKLCKIKTTSLNALDIFYTVIAHRTQKNLFFWGLAAVVGVVLGGVVFVNGLTSYSPDSWAYFELAKSVFSGSFYKFNTIRSYFFLSTSAAFPLGYPVFLAIGQALIGTTPLLAAYLNVVIAGVTVPLTARVAAQLSLTPVAGLTLVCATVLCPHYLQEVFNGRAIPLALLFFLLGCYVLLTRHLFLAGLFLGFSALVRFDYLAYGLLFLVGTLVLAPPSTRKGFGFIVGGFAVGLAPWIAYSFTHFGKVWVSDNSWVALSAIPAYVIDYPAEPKPSVFEAPELWAERIFQNVVPLMKSFFLSARRFPLFYIAALLFFFQYRKQETRMCPKLTITFFLIGFAFFPYLLTGYFDGRYFLPIWLVACFIFLYAAGNLYAVLSKRLLVIALILSLATGEDAIVRRLEKSHAAHDKEAMAETAIRRLARCHAQYPQTLFIFSHDVGELTARYGAETGLPTAFIPTNFEQMTDAEKDRYFRAMRPYILVKTLGEIEPCRPVR